MVPTTRTDSILHQDPAERLRHLLSTQNNQRLWNPIRLPRSVTVSILNAGEEDSCSSNDGMDNSTLPPLPECASLKIRHPSNGVASVPREGLKQDMNTLIPNKRILAHLLDNPQSQFESFKRIFAKALSTDKLEAMKNELSVFRQHSEDLNQLNNNIGTILKKAEYIRNEATTILEETREFDESCRDLMDRIQESELFTIEAKNHLSNFDTMDQLNHVLIEPWNQTYWKQQLKKNLFTQQLALLEERIQFLEQHLHYKQADIHLKKLKQLKTKVLLTLKEVVICGLKEVTTKIIKDIETQNTSPSGNKTLVTGNQDMDTRQDFELDIFENQFSLIYIDFQSQVEYLKKPVELIESFCQSPFVTEDSSSMTSRSVSTENVEFLPVLQECFFAYHEHRKTLLQPFIHQQAASLARTQNLARIARVGCSIIIQFTLQETKLAQKLFTSPYIKESFNDMILSFCSIILECLRTAVIQEDDLEELASCVEILRREIIHDAIRPKRNYLRLIEPIIHRMIQDVQERLIFRSSLFIRDNIQRYSPTDEDLNFPERLKRKEISNSEIPLPYEFWYPPLQQSLSLLSKLYNRVERMVFEGLAHEVVILCTESFSKASQLITQKASSLDGDLFLISHLLALRMELIPFDKLKLSTVETSFDFSHIKEGIMRFMKGQASLQFKNLIYDIVSNTQPKIVHNSVDSKKNLEKKLKTAYDTFVVSVTNMCFGDLMSFLKANYKRDDVDSEGVRDIYQKSIDNLKQIMTKELVPKMQLYIRQQKTRSELFKGIQDSLNGVHSQMLSQFGEVGGLMDMQEFHNMLSQYHHEVSSPNLNV